MAVTKDQLVVEVKIDNQGFDQKFKKSIDVFSDFSDTADASTKKVTEFETVLASVKDVMESMTIAKLTAEMARLYQVNADLTSKFYQMNDALVKTDGTVKLAVNSYGEMARNMGEISKASSEASSNIKLISAPLQNLADSRAETAIRSIAQSTNEVAKLKGFDELSKSVSELSTNLTTTNAQTTELNNNLARQSGFFLDLARNITTVLGTFQSLIMVAAGLLELFQAITNAETLAKLSRMADMLGMVADIKGFDKTADAVRGIGDALSYAAMKSVEFQIKFKENVEKINLMVEAQERATSLLASSAGILGTALAGIGIHKVGQNFEKYKTTVNPVINMMKDLAGSTNTFGKVVNSMSHPLIKLSEVFFILSPYLMAFSDKLIDSENTMLKSLGIASLLAAVLGGTLGYSISFLIGKISDFGVSIGVSMLASLAEAEAKFEKLQATMSQFTFTIQGLTKELGVGAVGSLDKWLAMVEQLRKNTIFSTADITKAVKYLVSEGVRFGLSQKNIADEIERVSDVASAYGENIVDVAQKFNAAMAGNSQALQNMGFAVGATNVAHSKLYQWMGRTTDALTKEEMAAVQLDLILTETASTIGAAANETKTLSGANAVLQKSFDDIATAMGSSNDIIISLNAAYARLVQSVSSAGRPFFEFIGLLKQIVGITLVVLGTVFKHIILIAAVTKAYEVFRASATASAVTIVGLNTAFTFLGTHLGFTAVAVTNLSSVFANLSKVMGALVLKGLASISTMLRTVAVGFVAAAQSVVMFTVSLLSNPMFLSASAIAIGIAAIATAMSELANEVFFVKQALDAVSASFSSSIAGSADKTEGTFSRLMDKIIKPLKAAFEFIKNVVKLSMAGLVSITILVSKAILLVDEFSKKPLEMISGGRFKSKVSDDQLKAIENLRKHQDRLNDAMGDTVRVIDETTSALGSMIVSEAQAATAMGSIGKKTKESDSALEKFVANQMRGFDEALERTMALGDEYDRLNAKLRQADQEVQKAYKSTKDFDEKAKAVAEARINRIKQEIELEKKRNEAIKAIDEQRRSIEIEQLKRSGQNISAINAEFKEKIDSIQEEEKGLKKIGQLRLEDQIVINQTIKALKAAKAAAIDDEKVKGFEKIRTIQDKITEIQQDNLSASRNEIDAINVKVADRLRELEALKKTFKAHADIKKEAFQLLEIGKQIAINTGNAAVERKRAEFLRAATDETRKMAASYADINTFGLAAIRNQNKETIIAIENKRREASIQGLLTKEVNQQYDIQRRLADDIMTLQIENTKRQYTVFGDFLNDFKSYFVMVQDLAGVSISNMFAGLEGILKNSLQLIDQFIGKTKQVGNPLEQNPNFRGPPSSAKQESPSFIGSMVSTATEYGAKAMETVSSSLSNVIPESLMTIGSDLASVVGSMGDMVSMLVKVIMNLPQIILGFIDQITASIESLFTFPVKLVAALSKLDALLERFIADFPAAIQKAMQKVPAILVSIAAKIPDFLINLVEELPNIVEKLSEAIPAIIAKIVVRLPAIFAAFGKAFIGMIVSSIKGILRGLGNVWSGKLPTIKVDDKQASKVIAQLTKDTNKLFSVNALQDASKSAQEQVAGITEAAAKAGKSIWQYFLQGLKDGWEWLKQAGEKIWDGLKRAVGVVADTFGKWGKAIWEGLLKALGNIAETLGKWGKAIWDGLLLAVGKIAETLGKWGSAIWDGLVNAIGTVAETLGKWGSAIWDGLVNAIGTVAETLGKWGSAIWDGVTGAIGTVAEKFGSWGSAIWDGVIGAVGKIGETFGKWGKAIWDGFLGPIGDTFAGFGGRIVEGLKAGINNLGTIFSSLFQNIGNTFKDLFKLDAKGAIEGIQKVFNEGAGALKDAFRAVINPVVDVFNGIIDVLNGMKLPEATVNIPGLGRRKLWGEMDIIPGDIDRIQKFAQGGLVKGPGGIDNVPAMLTAGEFVMSRPAVEAIGLPTLRAMNAGQSGPANVTQHYTFNLKIDAKDKVDETFIKQRLMPAIREELKRSSLDGRAIVYAGGVRA